MDVVLIIIPLLVVVPSSLTYFMPYACLLASCSVGIPYASAPVL